MRLRAAIYRKHVFHETRKNFQLDLSSPDDGHWEYSAIASNKRVTLRTLWAVRQRIIGVLDALEFVA